MRDHVPDNVNVSVNPEPGRMDHLLSKLVVECWCCCCCCQIVSHTFDAEAPSDVMDHVSDNVNLLLLLQIRIPYISFKNCKVSDNRENLYCIVSEAFQHVCNVTLYTVCNTTVLILSVLFRTDFQCSSRSEIGQQLFLRPSVWADFSKSLLKN